MQPLPNPYAPALPRLVTVNGATRLLVNESPVLLVGGELHNSSSSSLDYMDRAVWDRVASLNCNMVLAAISWELVEPTEGEFDFGLVDGLVEGARQRGIYLIPLWFGAFKNALSNYAPAWAKRDLVRFPRAETRPGVRTEAMSCLVPELAALDARAFAAVMRRIRDLDPADQTVVMAQVENEVGILRGPRDVSDIARRVYAEQVPSGLIGYLSEHRDSLYPALRALWERNGARRGGTWGEVFGTDPHGDEVFMAWHFASYVATVAAAGLAEHPIPMFANSWIVQHEEQTPGAFPSGGPVASMIDVWRAAAPEIAFLAPDIYLPGFEAECRRYAASGNPLFIQSGCKDPAACCVTCLSESALRRL